MKLYRPTLVITEDCPVCSELAQYAREELGVDFRVRVMCRKFHNITKRYLGRVIPPVVLFGDTIVNIGHSKSKMRGVVHLIWGV